MVQGLRRVRDPEGKANARGGRGSGRGGRGLAVAVGVIRRSSESTRTQERRGIRPQLPGLDEARRRGLYTQTEINKTKYSTHNVS